MYFLMYWWWCNVCYFSRGLNICSGICAHWLCSVSTICRLFGTMPYQTWNRWPNVQKFVGKLVLVDDVSCICQQNEWYAINIDDVTINKPLMKWFIFNSSWWNKFWSLVASQQVIKCCVHYKTFPSKIRYVKL